MEEISQKLKNEDLNKKHPRNEQSKLAKAGA